MSLRLRLIMAFVALSVVPLAAMTWYTYSSNAQALGDAAEHESDMLASELSQRMQLITTQLSERMERLMDMDSETSIASAATVQAAVAANRASPAPSVAVRIAPVAPAAVAAAPTAAAAAAQGPSLEASIEEAASKAAMEAQVADRLGDAAMLLNNVEIRGLIPPGSSFGRGGSGRRGPSAGRGPTGSDAPASARGVRPTVPRPPREGSPPAPGPGPSAPPTGGRPDQPPRFPRPAPSREGLPSGSGEIPTPAAAGSPPAVAASRSPDQPSGPSVAAGPAIPDQSDRIKIDLSELRRQMFREIAPDKPLQEMDSAERLRVIAEVNQRLLGIQQGLRLGAAELQKQAEEAKRESETTKPPVPAAGRAAAPAVPVRPAPKKPALTGNRLNVRSEKNGVVRQASAELNLPDLLQMVFAATPRDRGELPFAIDKDGHMYTPTPEARKRLEALGVGRADSNLGLTPLPDWIVRTTDDPSGSGLKFGIARPMGEALNEIRKTAARSAGLGLLFICATLIGIVPLSAGLTRNLSRLSAGVHRIAGGDYAARVSVKTSDEIGQLANAFNRMAGDVERHQHLAIGQERIKRELELGRQIQHDMLPHAPLRAGGTEIRGTSTAAGEVGGDFFNYFPLTGGQIAVLVGDVSGKGVGAALLMANIQASLRTRLALGQGLTALAEEVDRDIQENTPGPVYSTLFVGTFDPATRVLRYVNAGHNPQYVLRRRGGLERLESSGLPVGLLAGRGYAEGQVQLEAGDVVFCYTDGCVEAENEAGDMFSAEALERELLAAGPQSAEDLLRHMEEVFKKFRGTREPADDATMMVAKVG